MLQIHLCYLSGMAFTLITNQPAQTICSDKATCHCPTITGDKACSIVTLINEFVSETNPVSISFLTEAEYNAFLMYCAIASLRG